MTDCCIFASDGCSPFIQIHPLDSPWFPDLFAPPFQFPDVTSSSSPYCLDQIPVAPSSYSNYNNYNYKSSSSEETYYENPEVSNFSYGGDTDKKKRTRRLSPEQVRLLEANFEADNTLLPERKTRLANELGLEPRQVAIWFQNKRARFKTKQLEQDYDGLKWRYERLKAEYQRMVEDKHKLIDEVSVLNEKIKQRNEEDVRIRLARTQTAFR